MSNAPSNPEQPWRCPRPECQLLNPWYAKRCQSCDAPISLTEGVEPVSEVATILSDYYFSTCDPMLGQSKLIEARATARAAIERLIVEARVDELKKLTDFLGNSHLYDQDAAMKLRWHIEARLNQMKGQPDV